MPMHNMHCISYAFAYAAYTTTTFLKFILQNPFDFHPNEIEHFNKTVHYAFIGNKHAKLSGLHSSACYDLLYNCTNLGKMI